MKLYGFFALICVSIVLVECAIPLSRQKRGFLAGVHDRMGHGFGKRADSDSMSYSDFLDEDEDEKEDLMLVEDLVRHIMQNEVLADAVVKKFIDLNGDGRVSYHELLRKLMR